MSCSYPHEQAKFEGHVIRGGEIPRFVTTPVFARALTGARPVMLRRRQWLWRAIGQHGVVLDILVQERRNQTVAESAGLSFYHFYHFYQFLPVSTIYA